jgi:hypothetical protein
VVDTKDIVTIDIPKEAVVGDAYHIGYEPIQETHDILKDAPVVKPTIRPRPIRR